ncbi:hypothetical protein PsorP6_003083 [Peronosclerospora sorghi]|uniref:Uncharacterized protein n=1 Tax=Peronosclerospora sorghi TaxID=230839 RepID=A0ACC0VPC0_9STRA|nr:hypothetical protein PsorP6_003083 [Peronosclerospora sorghi]
MPPGTSYRAFMAYLPNPAYELLAACSMSGTLCLKKKSLTSISRAKTKAGKHPADTPENITSWRSYSSCKTDATPKK